MSGRGTGEACPPSSEWTQQQEEEGLLSCCCCFFFQCTNILFLFVKKTTTNNSFLIQPGELIVFIFPFQGITPELQEGLISVNEILEVSLMQSIIYTMIMSFRYKNLQQVFKDLILRSIRLTSALNCLTRLFCQIKVSFRPPSCS